MLAFLRSPEGKLFPQEEGNRAEAEELTDKPKGARTDVPFSVKSTKNGEDYYLHATTSETKSGSRTLYYFSKQVKEGAALDELPEGYEPSESPNGLIVLKKKAKE